MVLHDLNQAKRYSDYLISLLKGEVYKQGLPEEIFKEMIYEVFGLECQIIGDPVEGSPLCIPVGQYTRALKIIKRRLGFNARPI
ncbi:hypothetical protein GCM10026983_18650 [Gracilibacillus alcaliphilus]